VATFSPVAGVRQSGRLFALFLDVVRMTFKRPFQVRDRQAGVVKKWHP